MFRALRIGLFIGIVIGTSACAVQYGASACPTSGAYGSMEVGRTL